MKVKGRADPRLGRARQADRDDIDASRLQGQTAVRGREGRPCRNARSARHPVSCRSPWARPPRPCRSRWRGKRPTGSPSPGAKNAIRATSRERSWRAPTGARTSRRSSSAAAIYRGISQVPPAFSAIKIAGERAYDKARAGEEVELAPRLVTIDRLTLLSAPDPNWAEFETECGKGTYIRALARDMGRELGVYAHISALRRTAVGPFTESQMIPLALLEEMRHKAPGDNAKEGVLRPLETALDGIPASGRERCGSPAPEARPTDSAQRLNRSHRSMRFWSPGKESPGASAASSRGRSSRSVCSIFNVVWR